MSNIVYPSVEDVVEANRRVLKEIRVKKGDQHKVLSRQKIADALREARAEQGDVYDKAALLLTKLVRGHAFASGVRRTAYAVTISFLMSNGEQTHTIHDPRILSGIRERFYTTQEVKEWLKGNEIRKFTRGRI